MQDFDFGKHYQKNLSARAGVENPGGSSAWVKKLSLLGSIVIVTFFMGMITGIYYQKERFQAPSGENGGENITQTLNVNPNQGDGESQEEILKSIVSGDSSKSTKTPAGNKNSEKPDAMSKALQSDQIEYIILAKIYPSYEEAHLNGLKLQKIGLPVFLTESGQKMKVYVGPIGGKTRAYNMLSQIKKIREFNGAILYKK